MLILLRIVINEHDITYDYTNVEKRLLCQYLNEALSKENRSQDFIKDWLKKVNEGMPYQYILGTAPFYGLNLVVNKSVLIPRPETEEMVDYLTKNYHPNAVIDIGTGSGCIGLALKNTWRNAAVTATDLSTDALDTARSNADRMELAINFIQDDMLNPKGTYEHYELIVSNPPYIGIEEQLEPTVDGYEPKMALYAQGDVLKFYKSIAQFAMRHLTLNGVLMVEINQELGKETLEVFNDFEAKLLKDMSGNDRFILAKKKPTQ